MGKDDPNCKQCELSVGWKSYTVWLPEKFAVNGKVLIIDNDMTGCKETWTVTEVYSKSLPYSYLNERSQDYKKTREASDI